MKIAQSKTDNRMEQRMKWNAKLYSNLRKEQHVNFRENQKCLEMMNCVLFVFEESLI